MTGPEITGRDLSLMLADDIEGVVAALGLDVKRKSRRTIYAFSPWVNHANPKLEIQIGPKPGKWNDWVGGFYGDALGLVACVLSGNGLNGTDKAAVREAIDWTKKRYGLAADYDRDEWIRKKRELEARAKAREAQASRELTEARSVAQGLWLAAKPIDRTDPAGVYLRARGINLLDLKRQPRAIRYAAACRWYGGDGDVQHIGPAILSAMTLPEGKFGSLHRIWINPLRPGEKADLPIARKMWPQSDGCAIRLWRGASGLAERAAHEKGVSEDVVVCEGVEDGLSIALMTPELRVLAAGSLPGLLSFVPPKTTRRLIVAADNDWGKPQAQALLDRACARVRSEFNVPVLLARSPEGKDFNDLLKGGACV